MRLSAWARLGVRSGLGKKGGRSLHSAAAEPVVRSWIDAAVEALEVMPETCSLDVADRVAALGADDDNDRDVARLLGIAGQAVSYTAIRARRKLAQRLKGDLGG